MNPNKSRRQFESRARMRLISGRLKVQRKKVVDPLRRGVFVVPATITSLGLLAGFYSLISSINSHFELAAVMIAVAFICDGLDGRVARLSRSSSQFGVELDSLSRRGCVRRRARRSDVHLGTQAARHDGDRHLRPLRRLRSVAPCALQRADRQHRQAPLHRIARPRRRRPHSRMRPRLQLLRTQFPARPMHPDGAGDARPCRPDDLERALSQLQVDSSAQAAPRSRSWRACWS